MTINQEPKYTTNEHGKLVNRQSGEVIPDDEPVMIFRARDKRAKAAIAYYLGFCEDKTHREAVRLRLFQFEHWFQANPDRMKEPDTQLTADWNNLT